MSFHDQDDINHQDAENELNYEDVDDLTEYNGVDEDEETLRELIATVFSKARDNHMDCILQKITQGHFNTNAKNEYGNTLLHICAQNNHLETFPEYKRLYEES
jgi:ankyrin repeat protein